MNLTHRKGLGGLLAVSLVLAAGCNLNVTTPPLNSGTSASPGTSGTNSPRPTASPTATKSPSPSVSPSAPASPSGGDKEPNDDFAQAQMLTLGTALAATIGGDDEKDFYQVTVPAGTQDGNLTLSVTESSTEIAPFIRFYTSNKAEVDASGAVDATSSPTTLIKNVTAGKSYYIQISGGGTDMASYSVRADFTPVADTSERNDTFETAKALTSGTATDLFLFAGHETLEGTDEDFFKIEVPEGKTSIKVMIDNKSPAAEGQAHYVRLLNSAKEELDGAGATNEQADFDKTFTVEAAGTYYLKVTAGNSTTASTLTVTVE